MYNISIQADAIIFSEYMVNRMKYFELWLDESGDFEYDAEKVKKGFNCSFVGGILTEKSSVQKVNDLLEKEYFHCCENKDKSEQFEIFRRITELDCKFVIFNNTECIYTVDNNLTYQNIICEGIIKLLKRLKGQYGEFHLDIIIANRVDTTLGIDHRNSVVPLDSYLKAIESKLIILGLENSIDEKTRTITTASARKNKKLMLADIVCNTFLTRRSKGFSEEQRRFIDDVYKDSEKVLIFNVFDSSAEAAFNTLMCEGRLGEAVVVICQSRRTSLITKAMELVRENILNMNRNDIELQFKYVQLNVEYLIKVTREYEQCIGFIRNIDSFFLETLKHLEQPWSDRLYTKLHLDLMFYLFTLYTYRGDTVNSKLCEEECDRLFDDLENDWDCIQYSAAYKLRKISSLINQFEYDKAEAEANKLISQANDMKALLEVVSSKKEVHLGILAKALGCRAQIYANKMKTDPKYYSLAAEDSDNAIREFENIFDKKRQYFYRVNIEAIHGDYEKALEYLHMQSETDSIKALAVSAAHNGSFELYGYLLVMSYAKISGDPLADEMYRSISSLYDFRHKLDAPASNEHPYEVSLLALARYEAAAGNTASAVKNYSAAIEACFDHNDYCQWVIGLCACCEKYGCSGDSDHKRQIKQLHKRIIGSSDLPCKIYETVSSLDLSNTDRAYFISFARKII